MEKRGVRVLGEGLKKRGPREGFEEMRSGGVKTEEIGHIDFHSSEKSIVEQKQNTKQSVTLGKTESGVLEKQY